MANTIEVPENLVKKLGEAFPRYPEIVHAAKSGEYGEVGKFLDTAFQEEDYRHGISESQEAALKAWWEFYKDIP